MYICHKIDKRNIKNWQYETVNQDFIVEIYSHSVWNLEREISFRGDSKRFSAKWVGLFFNGMLKATAIYLRALGRSRRLPWWQAQFISAPAETPFTRSRHLFPIPLNLTLTSNYPCLANARSLPPSTSPLRTTPAPSELN